MATTKEILDGIGIVVEEGAETVSEETSSYAGYSIADLRKAFDRVADKKDWKGPIRAFILPDSVEKTIAAIVYFTATSPIVTIFWGDSWLIESEGYRNGPAGDH